MNFSKYERRRFSFVCKFFILVWVNPDETSQMYILCDVIHIADYDKKWKTFILQSLKTVLGDSNSLCIRPLIENVERTWSKMVEMGSLTPIL